jgi:hypothetical protein
MIALQRQLAFALAKTFKNLRHRALGIWFRFDVVHADNFDNQSTYVCKHSPLCSLLPNLSDVRISTKGTLG